MESYRRAANAPMNPNAANPRGKYGVIKDRYERAFEKELFRKEGDFGEGQGATMTAFCFSKKLDLVFMEPMEVLC
jgi:hypothetical protein